MDETAIRSFGSLMCLTLVFCGSGAPAAARDDESAWHADGALQRGLVAIDAELGAALGIPPERRCCGVLDLASGAVAMVRGNAMMYGASVPKIGILLGVFATRPDPARPLARDEFRELALMIRASDNDLAAKYARRVGLPRLAELYQSPRYRLYAPADGGGLWSGKYYGADQPRLGDPLGDLSHAASVRAVLRFYWLLERGELVSAAASRQMRAVFAAPAIDHHAADFVLGLRHRQVGVVRNLGSHDDWHLDSARVRHGTRRYALVGLVHHARGPEYLAGLAGRVDDLLVGGEPDKAPVSRLFTCRGDWWTAVAPSDLQTLRLGLPPVQVGGAAATGWSSPVLVADRLFNEVLMSWNLRRDADAPYAVEVRLGRSHDASWSPWLRVGGEGGVGGEVITTFADGKADVDIVRTGERYDLVQVRLLGGADGSLTLHRLAAVLTDATGLPVAKPDPQPAPFAPTLACIARLAVPFRSQLAEAAELRPRICSPTSVAMLLEYRGVARSTAEVASRIYDPLHDLYGNWPRAVQAAFEWGVPGYLARFADWHEVAAVIAQGQPLIISIAVRPGQLSGAPYAKTAGHLLVITGFDAAGDVHVNDPAAVSAAQGQTTYARAELEQVWMRRGGTAYVLMAR